MDGLLFFRCPMAIILEVLYARVDGGMRKSDQLRQPGLIGLENGVFVEPLPTVLPRHVFPYKYSDRTTKA